MNKKVLLATLLLSSTILGVTPTSASTSIKSKNLFVSVNKDQVKLYKNSSLNVNKKIRLGTVYQVKGYRYIKGKKYCRVYQENKKGEVVYKGYILNKNLIPIKGERVTKKFVTLTKNQQVAWGNLYLNKKLHVYQGTKYSSNFEVKNIYKIGNKKYYSLYRGKQWMGYMDSTSLKELHTENIAIEKEKYTVIKAAKIYHNLYFSPKGILTKGEKVKVKQIYTFGTGRKYGVVYNNYGKWLGYVNIAALKQEKYEQEDKKQLNKIKQELTTVLEETETILKDPSIPKEIKEKMNQMVVVVKEQLATNHLEAIKTNLLQLKQMIYQLNISATKTAINDLRETIHDAEYLYKFTENISVKGREKLQETLHSAKNLLDRSSTDKVTNQEIIKMTEDLMDTMVQVKFNSQSLAKQITTIKLLMKKVFLTVQEQRKFENIIEKIEQKQAMSYDEYLSVTSILESTKVDLEKHPDKADGEKLKKLMGQANLLINKGVYKDTTLKEIYRKANHLIITLDKATEKISKDEMQKIIHNLTAAIENLEMNGNQIQEFLKAAKELMNNDKYFQNDKEFQKSVNELDIMLKNNAVKSEKVLAKSREVYQIMIHRLQKLYQEVLPWNNNQETINPKVTTVYLPTLKVEEPTFKHVVVSGKKNLTQDQFAQQILKVAPRVRDYYTKESYDEFAQALTLAKKRISNAKVQNERFASELSVQQITEAMHRLVEAKQKLTFNRQKLISLLISVKKARRIWVEEQNKIAKGYPIKVKAQSSAANKRFIALSAKLGYSLRKEKDQYREGDKKKFFATKEQVHELLIATRKNADLLAQLLYNAENDYYKYISTVKWSSKDNKFIPINDNKKIEKSHE